MDSPRVLSTTCWSVSEVRWCPVCVGYGHNDKVDVSVLHSGERLEGELSSNYVGIEMLDRKRGVAVGVEVRGESTILEICKAYWSSQEIVVTWGSRRWVKWATIDKARGYTPYSQLNLVVQTTCTGMVYTTDRGLPSILVME